MKKPQRGGEGGRQERKAWASSSWNVGYMEGPEKHTLVVVASNTDLYESPWTPHLQRGMLWENIYIFPHLHSSKEKVSRVSRQAPNEEIRANITNECGR